MGVRSAPCPVGFGPITEECYRYQVICQILCPEGTAGILGYNNVDMSDVMELDERDDGDVRDRDLEIGLTLMTNIVNN